MIAKINHTMIVNMLLDRMVGILTEVCQTAINENDLAYCDVVKKGLLQSNKTGKNVQLGVTGGDHEDPAFLDSIITARGMQMSMGVDFPYAREVGGGQLWFRRGIVRVEAFFIRERLTEDEAHQAAYEILGRVEQAVDNLDVSDMVDDFGERAVEMYCYHNTFFESGGPPKSYIFRGKVAWWCLTERP